MHLSPSNIHTNILLLLHHHSSHLIYLLYCSFSPSPSLNHYLGASQRGALTCGRALVTDCGTHPARFHCMCGDASSNNNQERTQRKKEENNDDNNDDDNDDDEDDDDDDNDDDDDEEEEKEEEDRK
ncbi:hypothetical protein E2C01_042431 [Portunus trituberculatus]|uniref:Uncharacterized protein n=1 Tax=Portunus trituberculatus TaxID=210409 RepID=A0A5B7FLV5_PORTR|nr:hypothetical protein [Portunus trituberculatus]